MNKAFTLIEVMAAMAILSIAMLVLMNNQTGAMTQVLRVQNYERGVMITENQMHWTYLDLNEAQTWEDYADLSGEDGDYQWSVHIEPMEMETQVDARVVMLHIQATTTWPQGKGQNSYQLESLYLWGEE